jgi:AcrR family transcriptional regulator
MMKKSAQTLPTEAPEQSDLRVRRTHKLLWAALLEELAERPFAEISVKDICERAMVHRTTFYKHYTDKYALLEHGMQRIVDDLGAAEGHLAPSAYSATQPPPYFVRLFEHAAQHAPFYRLMLSSEENGRFQRLLKQYIVKVALTKLTPARAGLESELAVTMHAHFIAGAALSLLSWWLDEDMPLTPLQMASVMLTAPNAPLDH